MKNKKYRKDFSINIDGKIKYVKLESDYIFGRDEGILFLSKKYPKADEIKCLDKKLSKVISFFDLKKTTPPSE